MLHDLFIQGYGCTAVLLFILFFSHKKYQYRYVKMAKTANRIIWLFSLAFLSFMFLSVVILTFIFKQPDHTDWLKLVYLPYGIVVISLLFNKIGDNPVWVLLPAALLLNIATFFQWANGIRTAYYSVSWLNSLPPWLLFILSGICFILLILLVQWYFNQTARDIKKEKNKLPDRI